MKRVVVLILCLSMVAITLSLPIDNEEVQDMIKKDCVEDDCTDECRGESCYNNCRANYRGGCRQRCRSNCERSGRCCNEERGTTPKTILPTPTTTGKSKTDSTKVEDSFDLTAAHKNMVDAKTNLLMTNKINNENSVHIPIEVHQKNVNDFVIELAPPSSGGTVVKKEKTETEIETDSEEEDNCCNGGGNSCCNGINNNCCQQNSCGNNCQQQQQQGCSQNCNYAPIPQVPYTSPCQSTYYNGKPITICPNELATQQYLIMMKQSNGNGDYHPEKMTLGNAKGCNLCIYCDGVYNPSVCMKTPQCSDVCRNYLLDPKTVSPIKCTLSTTGEYACKRVY